MLARLYRLFSSLTTSTLPSSQLALFTANAVPDLALRTHAVPNPGPGEVLIKVEAVALNPTDWKLTAYGLAQPGNGAGNDYAGRVVALGRGEHNVSVGDKVAGRMRPGFDKRDFAFQQYLAARSDLLIKTPDNVSFEDASTLTIAATTALLGMKRLVGFPGQAEPGKTILVSGGTSCVGMYVCQFAEFSGLRIIATASPRHFDLVRSLGASSVIDHRAPDVLQQILKAAGTSGVDYAFDAISTQDTVRLVSEVLKAKPRGEKKAATVLPLNPANVDPAVNYCPVSASSIYNQNTPTAKSDYETALTVYKAIYLWLEQGKLKPSPVTLKPGGLNGVSEGLALLKAGQVSATKLVYRVADTVAPSPSA